MSPDSVGQVFDAFDAGSNFILLDAFEDFSPGLAHQLAGLEEQVRELCFHLAELGTIPQVIEHILNSMCLISSGIACEFLGRHDHPDPLKALV